MSAGLKISKATIPSLGTACKILENGMSLFVIERPKLPIATVQLWVKTGSIHEGEFMGSGLSHFLEHMIFNGSRKYPKNKIAEISAENGGRINAGTSYGYTVYYIDILAEFTELAIDIVADAVMNPLFPEECFASEKEVILRERAMYSDSPSHFISEKVLQTMFSEHPMRHPIIGYKEKIEKVSRDMMVEYFERRYSPQRSFLVVCGNIVSEDIFKIAEDKFSSWRMGCIREDGIPFEPPQSAIRIANFAFKDPLHRIGVAFHAPYASSPDAPALDLLSMALGANRSSRLATKLERAEKLAISANAYSLSSYFCGIFNVSACCEPANAARLKQRLFEEMASVADDNPIGNNEIRRCEIAMISDYLRQMRESHSIASIAAVSIINFGNPEHSKIYFEKIATITKKELLDVARKYLTTENCSLVEVAPHEKPASPAALARPTMEKTKTELKTLENGLRVITAPDSSLCLADVCVVIPGGSLVEGEGFGEASVLVAELLDAGTEKLHEEEIAGILDENAITLDVSSNSNCITINLSCHSSVLETALEILFEMLARPSFPNEQFEREKQNILGTIASRRLSPRMAAENLFRKTLFGSHPYSRPLPADDERIEKMSPKLLRQFYFSRCLCPEKTVIGISGDFKPEKTFRKIAKFAETVGWKKYKLSFPPEPEFPEGPILCSEKIPREQAVVMLGVPGCAIRSPDMPALRFLSKGSEGMNSRIFKKIRCDSALAYYTGMSLFSGFHPGYAAFYVGTHPEAAEQALELIDEVRREIVSCGLDESEFKSAKTGLEREIAETRSNSGLLIASSTAHEYLGLGFNRLDNLEKEYLEMDNSRIIGAAKKYLDTKSIVRVKVGPN